MKQKPGEAVSLDDLAATVRLRPPSLVEKVADELISIFRFSVLSTVAMTVVLAGGDYFFIGKGWIQPDDRLVSEKVLLAVIGATLVQLGAAIATITYAVFQVGRREPNKSSADAD